jgi:hypothetical protein
MNHTLALASAMPTAKTHLNVPMHTMAGSPAEGKFSFAILFCTVKFPR